jgi:hypothetical protein
VVPPFSKYFKLVGSPGMYIQEKINAKGNTPETYGFLRSIGVDYVSIDRLPTDTCTGAPLRRARLASPTLRPYYRPIPSPASHPQAHGHKQKLYGVGPNCKTRDSAQQFD